MHDQANLR